LGLKTPKKERAEKPKEASGKSYVLLESRQGEPPNLHKPIFLWARKVGGCLDGGKRYDILKSPQKGKTSKIPYAVIQT